MINITLNDKQVKKAIRKVQVQLKNPKPFLRTVGKRELEKAEDRIRKTKLNPDNRGWAPWAYSTILQRTREGNATRGILYRTGDLLRGFYGVLKSKSVEIRNRIPYAEYLQFGTSNMPRREFMGFGRDSIESLPKEFKKFIMKAWK